MPGITISSAYGAGGGVVAPRVAERLQLSRGRVAQLHKEALERLRQMLARQDIGAFSC